MSRTLGGVMKQTNLSGESEIYLAKREELRQAEVELMQQRERVAELRRQLPEGALVEDYEFEEGPTNLNEGDTPIRKVRLSQLFTGPNRSVVIYHFMYGKRQVQPCPMCIAWLDAWNGVAYYLAERVDVAIVAAADNASLRTFARQRGWNNLRMLSAGKSTFKYDLASEDSEGHQDSTVSVFERDRSGRLRHFYSAHPRMADVIHERGLDLLNPIFNIFDLTPQGRGDWYASFDYAPSLWTHSVS